MPFKYIFGLAPFWSSYLAETIEFVRLGGPGVVVVSARGASSTMSLDSEMDDKFTN